ncbi:hypothetical protein [Legionella nagasakiensis]|uniref:hypothetical protein n=1 Tax=Legionella nagasakiensis TaxID=535290 RepID=UPI00105572ED|nr:hypothetical protein [Legionella nagasakiensis]
MPHHSEVLTIELRDHTTIQLRRKDDGRELSGISKKGLYQDQDGKDYYVKESKSRKAVEIFKNDAFFNALMGRRCDLLGDGVLEAHIEIPEDEETQRRIEDLSTENRMEFEQIQASLVNYTKHVDELVLSNTALEILAPRICGAIMGDLLVVPRNYLHIHERHLLVISPSVGMLREFLSEHPQVEPAKTPDHWLRHPPPDFATLVTTEEQARMLGQAYFVALLFGHYDLVNNINLSNLGCICQPDDTLKLSIVDWGNSLGVGFGGFTAEEGAFKNPQFNRESSRVDYLGYRLEDITGFQHLMPFDTVVYPLLPRQVVPTLFDLTAEDKPLLREAQRRGFYEACEQAASVLAHAQEIIPVMVAHVLEEAMSDENTLRIKPLLPSFITVEKTEKKDAYTLANILAGRMHSLQKMKEALQRGKKLQDISHDRFMAIAESQLVPSIGFFASPRASASELETAVAPALICGASRFL